MVIHAAVPPGLARWRIRMTARRAISTPSAPVRAIMPVGFCRSQEWRAEAGEAGCWIRCCGATVLHRVAKSMTLAMQALQTGCNRRNGLEDAMGNRDKQKKEAKKPKKPPAPKPTP